MASRVRELASGAGAPLGVVLEGGYNRSVLAECVCATLPALTGDAEPVAELQAPAQPDPILAAAIEHQRRYWPL
jgi:acetoin utilization deacetylase AcuC-like enzyme